MEILTKLRCYSVEDNARPGENMPATCVSVRLEPVYASGGNENASFACDTPSGSVQFEITNPAAFGCFQQGKNYYGRFTEAPADEVNAVATLPTDPVPTPTTEDPANGESGSTGDVPPGEAGDTGPTNTDVPPGEAPVAETTEAKDVNKYGSLTREEFKGK